MWVDMYVGNAGELRDDSAHIGGLRTMSWVQISLGVGWDLSAVELVISTECAQAHALLYVT